MIIDLHIHEKTYSSDSHIALEDIIDKAMEMGLDGVCITDHESVQLREKAHVISREKNFPVFVGAEVLTYEGDLLVYGLDHLPSYKMHAEELAFYVTSRGGAVISAHPYRKNNRGLEDHVKNIECLSGVEGLNGSTPLYLNLQAMEAAEESQKPVFGGSDAHVIQQVGKYATRFNKNIACEKELAQAILEGNVTPVYHWHGTYLDFNLEELVTSQEAV